MSWQTNWILEQILVELMVQNDVAMERAQIAPHVAEGHRQTARERVRMLAKHGWSEEDSDAKDEAVEPPPHAKPLAW